MSLLRHVKAIEKISPRVGLRWAQGTWEEVSELQVQLLRVIESLL